MTTTAPLPTPTEQATHPQLYRGVAGLLAVAAGLGAGELVAGIMKRSSPITTVAGAVIDNVPGAMERWAISNFGRNDKKVLGIGIVVALALAGWIVGVRSKGRRGPAIVGALIIGALGAGASLADRVGGAGDAVPSVFAAAIGLAVLLGLLWTIDRKPVAVDHEPVADGVDRRRFLAMAGVSAGAAAGMVVVGRKVGTDGGAVASRSEVAGSLPRPAVKLPAPPKGVDFGIEGLTPWTVPNADFYRIDTAFVVPRIDARTWKLTIDGLVKTPRTYTYDQLLKRDLVEADVTLMCVSNEIGGNLVGNARWLGVPLKELLEEAGVDPEAEQVFSTSADGWTSGFPKELALDGRNALVAVGMNGEPLPFAHGFPARLVVPGIYGYVSATKWLTQIELLKWDRAQGYWIPRGWAQQAPVKTSSRIDVPNRRTAVGRGPTPIAGVAWAQHRGIAKVEVQVDDGPWKEATLAEDGSIDSWRQWKLVWDATPGKHSIRVRATDKQGKTQSPEYVDVAPNGAEGWHTIDVTID